MSADAVEQTLRRAARVLARANGTEWDLTDEPEDVYMRDARALHDAGLIKPDQCITIDLSDTTTDYLRQAVWPYNPIMCDVPDTPAAEIANEVARDELARRGENP